MWTFIPTNMGQPHMRLFRWILPKWIDIGPNKDSHPDLSKCFKRSHCYEDFSASWPTSDEWRVL